MTTVCLQRIIDRRNLRAHRDCLMLEIEHLKTMLQPHDTGHIHTAISVLSKRVEELGEEIDNILK